MLIHLLPAQISVLPQDHQDSASIDSVRTQVPDRLNICEGNYCTYSPLSRNGNILLDGSANTSCITTVSKARLGNQIVKLSNSDLEAVEDSLDISLGTIRRTNKLKAEIDRLKKYIGTLLNQKGN